MQLVEPISLLDIGYETDLKVEIVRHVQETLIISSEEGAFSIKVQFEGPEARDLATLLIRKNNLIFNENPDQVRELSEKEFYARKEHKWIKELETMR